VKLPERFMTKMSDLLKDEADAFFHTYTKEKASGLRINPIKISSEEWERLSPFSLQKIPFVQNGYYYDPEIDQPGKHPYHAAGLYYIQEPSAMFVAEQLDPKGTEKVLDLCAAPGGKTTQLAGLMNNEGLLLANEIHLKRAKALSENIERLGITNTVVTNETPEKLAERFPGYFDKILVDAPCSGEGMFRKDEEAIEFWSEQHVEACAIQQRKILDSAYKMLKEGGILVYSTCTFSPEENEQTIEHFIEKFPDMELVDIQKPSGVDDGNPSWTKSKNNELTKAARLWPHHLKGEGHFVAKLRKNGNGNPAHVKPAVSNVTKNQVTDYFKFVKESLSRTPYENLYLYHQQLYSLPEDCFDLKGLKVVRAGLHLGELKKNRFEPNHALALALKIDEAVHTFSLTSENNSWLRYVKGETFSSGGDRGWMLVTIDGYPLGWGKEAKGTLKNFYPKGLRIQGL
jgi:NOL1/NOP2/sun family putative RNA methylase